MIVGVIGSRHSGSLTEDNIIGYIPSNCSHIVSGGSSGVDSLAARAAVKLGLALTEILPDYEHYGRSAPIKRNVEIIKKSDMLLAFWDMKSPGTRFVIAECLKQKKYIKVITI